MFVSFKIIAANPPEIFGNVLNIETDHEITIIVKFYRIPNYPSIHVNQQLISSVFDRKTQGPW